MSKRNVIYSSKHGKYAQYFFSYFQSTTWCCCCRLIIIRLVHQLTLVLPPTTLEDNVMLMCSRISSNNTIRMTSKRNIKIFFVTDFWGWKVRNFFLKAKNCKPIGRHKYRSFRYEQHLQFYFLRTHSFSSTSILPTSDQRKTTKRFIKRKDHSFIKNHGVEE